MSSVSVITQKQDEALGYCAIGGEIPMTLQIVIGGTDGFLIATDTKQVVYPHDYTWSEDSERSARTDQVGVGKIVFNQSIDSRII